MKVEYDRSTDAAYLMLCSVEVERSESLLPWLIADYASEGRLVGLEVLDASSHLDLSRLEPLVELVGTREAAGLLGVQVPNFIRDWASRENFPRPLAELAATRVWDRREVLAYRDAHRQAR